jgi:hypothetical protein
VAEQREFDLFEQDFLIGFWMGVAALNQSAPVGSSGSAHRASGWRRTCPEPHVGSCRVPADATGLARSPAGSRPERRQRYAPRSDARVGEEWAQRQVVLQVLKGRFDFDGGHATVLEPYPLGFAVPLFDLAHARASHRRLASYNCATDINLKWGWRKLHLLRAMNVFEHLGANQS